MMAAMTEAFRHSLDGKDKDEITEIVMQIHRQIQRTKRIVVPCMNNKVLLLNLET